MQVLISRRQVLLSILGTTAIASLGGCGETPEIAVLPDQGKVKLPEDRTNELKPKKGMDRNGS